MNAREDPLVMQNEATFITVMIPCYNQSEFLVRALDSVMAQTYQNFEVVISDDCSSDNTSKVVEEYINKLSLQNKIKYYRNQNNLGYLRNYYTTLNQRAAGNWIINLDGDDFFIDEDFFQRSAKEINETPEAVLLLSNYKEFHSYKDLWINIQSNLPAKMTTDEFLNHYALGRVRWNHNAILYKREVAKSIGFYWDPEIPMNDWESFLRLSCHGTILYDSKHVAAWVQHTNNLTRITDIKKYKNNFLLIDGLINYFSERNVHKGIKKRIISHLINTHISEPIINMFKHRNFSGGIQFISFCLKKYPFKTLCALLNPKNIIKILLSFFPNIYNSLKKLINKA